MLCGIRCNKKIFSCHSFYPVSESFLKKREGGQTIQEDRAQDKRGQGEGPDPCRDVPENPLADLTRYNEVNHWMHFLCNLRSLDPSEAFAGKLT